MKADTKVITIIHIVQKKKQTLTLLYKVLKSVLLMDINRIIY